MASPKTAKEDSSIVSAPHPITPACFSIDGMAMLPTIDAPVRNLVKFTHPSFSFDMIDGESEPRKNMSGIGSMRYIRTVNIGHQLLYRAQAKICNTIPPETSIARAASLPLCRHVLILRDSAIVPLNAVQVCKFRARRVRRRRRPPRDEEAAAAAEVAAGMGIGLRPEESVAIGEGPVVVVKWTGPFSRVIS